MGQPSTGNPTAPNTDPGRPYPAIGAKLAGGAHAGAPGAAGGADGNDNFSLVMGCVHDKALAYAPCNLQTETSPRPYQDITRGNLWRPVPLSSASRTTPISFCLCLLVSITTLSPLTARSPPRQRSLLSSFFNNDYFASLASGTLSPFRPTVALGRSPLAFSLSPYPSVAVCTSFLLSLHSTLGVARQKAPCYTLDLTDAPHFLWKCGTIGKRPLATLLT